jgi:hypothetical protein
MNRTMQCYAILIVAIVGATVFVCTQLSASCLTPECSIVRVDQSMNIDVNASYCKSWQLPQAYIIYDPVVVGGTITVTDLDIDEYRHDKPCGNALCAGVWPVCMDQNVLGDNGSVKQTTCTGTGISGTGG